MSDTSEMVRILYENGDRDTISHLFRKKVGISWNCLCPEINHEKFIEPIYIACWQLKEVESDCCSLCLNDNHAGDYDNSQGRVIRQYIESKNGLIIFYCCCDHQDLDNLLNILDRFIDG